MVNIDSFLRSKNFKRKNKQYIFIQPIDELKDELPKNPSAIRERLRPRLYDYSYVVTLSAKKVLNQMLKLIPKRSVPLKILDLGCGYKPFQPLFPNDWYCGVDISLNSFADVIADNHNLPFKDNIFDIIIISEVLEHCDNEYRIINEMRRVAKNKALVYLTLPFIFPIHGVPHDFNRFTSYKLKSLFKNDDIVSLQASNNIFGSIFIFINMILRILFGSVKILFPVYIINNLLALLLEKLGKFCRDDKGFIAEYWQYALASFPIGYSMIVKIKK